jgi:hypothetical protein
MFFCRSVLLNSSSSSLVRVSSLPAPRISIIYRTMAESASTSLSSVTASGSASLIGAGNSNRNSNNVFTSVSNSSSSSSTSATTTTTTTSTTSAKISKEEELRRVAGLPGRSFRTMLRLLSNGLHLEEALTVLSLRASLYGDKDIVTDDVNT